MLAEYLLLDGAYSIDVLVIVVVAVLELVGELPACIGVHSTVFEIVVVLFDVDIDHVEFTNHRKLFVVVVEEVICVALMGFWVLVDGVGTFLRCGGIVDELENDLVHEMLTLETNVVFGNVMFEIGLEVADLPGPISHFPQFASRVCSIHLVEHELLFQTYFLESAPRAARTPFSASQGSDFGCISIIYIKLDI